MLIHVVAVDPGQVGQPHEHRSTTIQNLDAAPQPKRPIPIFR